jgi:hypothetical protein
MTALKMTSSALLVATTLVVAACSSGHDTAKPSTPQNMAPTLAAIANQSVNQDTVIGPISLAINDAETAPDLLNVAASSDNANVIPADGIVVAGSGGTRTLTLTPFEAATGTTTLAVIVTDAQGASTTQTFSVAVNARNASIKSGVVDTFAKGDSGEPTPVNGFTFQQDADDPTAFAALIPAEEE